MPKSDAFPILHQVLEGMSTDSFIYSANKIPTPDFSHIETLILYRIVLPLMYSIQRNAAFLYQRQQYFRAGLRRGAISTYHFNKLVLQPAQASVHAGRIPAQAGEVSLCQLNTKFFTDAGGGCWSFF